MFNDNNLSSNIPATDLQQPATLTNVTSDEWRVTSDGILNVEFRSSGCSLSFMIEKIFFSEKASFTYTYTTSST